MKSNSVFSGALLVVLAIAGEFLADGVQPASPVTTTPAVYVPDTTHQNDPLPDGVIAWDDLTKAADATNGQDFARFTFAFTNVTAGNVVILNVHPSCGCTQPELPAALPWILSPGSNGHFGLKVNIAGKSGMLPKYVDVSTDKGTKRLNFSINILPPPPMPEMTEAQRTAGIAAAKVDRQAVFKGDCASCHAKNVQGQYGQQLFDTICAVCHEAEHRATMVPDLHALKVPTNEDFWRIWIAHGKAGSLMPAFSSAEGGPLNDMQIASLAAYLNSAIPSKAPPPPQ